MLVLISGVAFMAVVNTVMINIALPFIGRDFGVSEGTYGWVVTGYAATFGIFSAVSGRLADILGRRRLYIAGIVVLGTTSIALAFGPSLEFIIAVRIVQGAGASTLPVIATAIITQLVPIRARGAAMGVVLATIGVAASIGPFLGGALVQLGGWRFTFAFTALVLLGLPIAVKLLPATLDEVSGKRFDIPGAILLAVGVGSLIYSFDALQKAESGSQLVVTLAVGVAALLSFALWIRRCEVPFARPELFADLRYVAACAVAFLVNLTRFGTIVLVPILLTEVAHLEPIWIGLVLFPGALLIAVFSRMAGGIADRIGPRRPVTIGAVFITLGAMLSAYYAGGSPWGLAAGMALYGLGFALIQSPLVAHVSQLVPRQQTGVGLGIFMMIFFVGGATGVALSVTIVELQPVDALSWLGFQLGGGARYSNAMLVLVGLAAMTLLLATLLPRRDEVTAHSSET